MAKSDVRAWAERKVGGAPTGNPHGAQEVKNSEVDRKNAQFKSEQAERKGTAQAHKEAREAHQDAARSAAKIHPMLAEKHTVKAAEHGKKEAELAGKTPSASTEVLQGHHYGKALQRVKEATDRAKVAGTSPTAWREAAKEHRNAAETAGTQHGKGEHLAKAKEYEKRADEYARDEQGRFASK